MLTSNFESIVENLRVTFRSGKTKSYKWRIGQLRALKNLFETEEDALKDALKKDLRKNQHESIIAEINLCLSEVVTALNYLADWMKPTKTPFSLVTLSDNVEICWEPLGVVLIIGAWNYPVQLVFAPLIGAIMAGNCALVKPSEVAPETSKLLSHLISKYLDVDAVRVVEGGVEETTDLLKLRYDHIFYTGNSAIARVIMEAAAKHLTPVTLELGGKSPVYVAKDASLVTTSQRIIWGKFMNAGQTCIAPDYVLCERGVAKALIEEMKHALDRFYGDNPKESPDFGRIINERHWVRLTDVLKKSNGVVIVGGAGEADRNDRYIPPTLLQLESFEDATMKDELFGPILPIIEVNDEQEACEYIQRGSRPLALYVFTNNTRIIKKFRDDCLSGGFMANDTVLHCAIDGAPFGGVGDSGMGRYHGRDSFECFSHKRTVVLKHAGMEMLNLWVRYPPYTPFKLKSLRFLFTKTERWPFPIRVLLPWTLLSLLFAFVAQLLGYGSGRFINRQK